MDANGWHLVSADIMSLGFRLDSSDRFPTSGTRTRSDHSEWPQLLWTHPDELRQEAAESEWTIRTLVGVDGFAGPRPQLDCTRTIPRGAHDGRAREKDSREKGRCDIEFDIASEVYVNVDTDGSFTTFSRFLLCDRMALTKRPRKIPLHNQV